MKLTKAQIRLLARIAAGELNVKGPLENHGYDPMVYYPLAKNKSYYDHDHMLDTRKLTPLGWQALKEYADGQSGTEGET